jgi:PBSX family phage portal protein
MRPVEETDEDFLEDMEEREQEDAEPDTEVLVVKGAGGHGFAERVAKEAGQAVGAGQSKTVEVEHQSWEGADILEPPLSPAGLLWMFRNSQYLRSNVDAMAHNIDGFGWYADPVLDFESDDIDRQVETAMILHRMQTKELSLTDDSLPDLPSEKEVQATRKVWQKRAALEKAYMRQHFEYSCFEHSFIELRRRKTIDRESIGWGAWEIIEDESGKPVRYKHVSASTLRISSQQEEPVEVEEYQHTSPVTYRKIKVMRRFRLVIQQEDYASTAGYRFFRELGDPRVISHMTGAVFESVDDLKAKEGQNSEPANQILMFPIYFPGTAYGVVRHHGVLPQLKGAWFAANNVVDYLQNNAIPRALLLVNDGKLNKRSVRDLRNYFGSVRGQAENRLAIIQAMTPKDRAFDGATKVKLEVVSLREAQRDDATFLEYTKRGQAEVGQVFRLLPILRGDTSDFNRATAQAALRFAEEQVFQPERADFDWIINRRILPLLGIRFWRFKSRAPSVQDPERLAAVAEKFAKQGVVVPAELRTVAERALGIDLLRDAGDWQQLPQALIMQGFKPPARRPVTSLEPERAEQATGAGDKDPNDGPQDPPEREVLKAALDLLAHRRSMEDGLLTALAKGYRDRIDDVATEVEALLPNED